MQRLLAPILLCVCAIVHAVAQSPGGMDTLRARAARGDAAGVISTGPGLLQSLPANALPERMEVHLALADAYYASQSEVEATRHAQEALSIAEAKADTVGRMRATRQLAELLFAAGRYEDAVSMERDGARLAQAHGDRDLLAKFLSGVADNYVMLSVLDSAEHYYRSCLASLPPEELRQRTITECNLAKVFSERGDHAGAIAILEPSLSRMDTLDAGKYAKAMNMLAYVYHKADRHREAITAFTESERLNQRSDKDISTTLENLGFAAESHAALGEHKAAYTTMLELEEQLHAYYARTANDEILALEKRFETERKEQENTLLRAENAERKLNEQRLRTRWIAVAALAVLLLGLLGLLYRNYRVRGQHARQVEGFNKELATQRDQVQRMNDLLELKVLRAQLNPHFIHNCQNSAIALVKEGRDQEALVYLQGLSKLMRMVLEHSVKDRITLESELDFLRHYLSLEALRLKGLHYTVSAADELMHEEVLLPALLVQPFVENAIWHGLAGKQGERNVTVLFTATPQGLRCTVTDNGVGRKSVATRTAGEHSYATELTQERLLLLTHRMQQKGSIAINDLRDDQGAPRGTEVVIELEV